MKQEDQIAHLNGRGVDPLNEAPGAKVYPLEEELPLDHGSTQLIQGDQGLRHPPGGKNGTMEYHKNKVPGLLLLTTMAKEAREAKEAKDMLEARAKDGYTAAKGRGVLSHLNPKFLNYPLIPLLDIHRLFTNVHQLAMQS